MTFGDPVGIKLPDICLTGEDNPEKKKTPRKPVPTGDQTRALLVTDALCYYLRHSGGQIIVLCSPLFFFSKKFSRGTLNFDVKTPPP